MIVWAECRFDTPEQKAIVERFLRQEGVVGPIYHSWYGKLFVSSGYKPSPGDDGFYADSTRKIELDPVLNAEPN